MASGMARARRPWGGANVQFSRHPRGPVLAASHPPLRYSHCHAPGNTTVIEGWVAVTDNDWFDQLAKGFQHDEVNFWNPTGKTFTGSRGAPFFFKLKARRNAIGGFGFVGHFAACRICWLGNVS